jgi:hypothetical protein
MILDAVEILWRSPVACDLAGYQPAPLLAAEQLTCDHFGK